MGSGLTGNECQSDSCEGLAICDDGFCQCPPGVLEVAPKFCLQSWNKPTFITYDQYNNLIDTLVIEFEVEPFSHTWKDGDNYYRSVDGRMYNRDPWVIGQLPHFVAILPYPGDPNIPVDTIIIPEIIDKPTRTSTRYYYYPKYSCRKNFVGAFTDRNTIEGNIYIYFCQDNGTDEGILPDSLLPAGLQEEISRTYPVTFKRIL
ncbi:hypothetical protein A3850_001180 [Lewinella sp. 4G2]|nr:hypothetical protein A3850_001180 [Lewinella sp. 4G2]